jgi:hypothetical protein
MHSAVQNRSGQVGSTLLQFPDHAELHIKTEVSISEVGVMLIKKSLQLIHITHPLILLKVSGRLHSDDYQGDTVPPTWCSYQLNWAKLQTTYFHITTVT